MILTDRNESRSGFFALLKYKWPEGLSRYGREARKIKPIEPTFGSLLKEAINISRYPHYYHYSLDNCHYLNSLDNYLDNYRGFADIVVVEDRIREVVVHNLSHSHIQMPLTMVAVVAAVQFQTRYVEKNLVAEAMMEGHEGLVESRNYLEGVEADLNYKHYNHDLDHVHYCNSLWMNCRYDLDSICWLYFESSRDRFG